MVDADNSTGEPAKLSKKALKKQEAKAAKEAKKAEKKAILEASQQPEADDFAKEFYGNLNMIQSTEKPGFKAIKKIFIKKVTF